MLAPRTESSEQPIAVLGAGVALTFFDPRYGVALLTFSMLLSPEIGFGSVGRRTVTLRIDDMLLIAIFVTWMVKTALDKDAGFLVFGRSFGLAGPFPLAPTRPEAKESLPRGCWRIPEPRSVGCGRGMVIPTRKTAQKAGPNRQECRIPEEAIRCVILG